MFGHHRPVIKFRENTAKDNLVKVLKTERLERKAVCKSIYAKLGKGKEAMVDYKKVQARCNQAENVRRRLYRQMREIGKKHKDHTMQVKNLQKRRQELSANIDLTKKRLDKQNKSDDVIFEKTAEQLARVQTERASLKKAFGDYCIANNFDQISPAEIGPFLRSS